MYLQETLSRSSVFVMLLLSISCNSGCITSIYNSVPVRHLPPHLLADSHSADVSIAFSILGQPRPEEHHIGPGDVLGIHVTGIIQSSLKSSPMVRTSGNDENSEYLSIGVPFTVKPDGTVTLPIVGTIKLSEKPLSAAVRDVRHAYLSKQQLIDPTETQVRVELIKPRTYHVTVIREDSSGSSFTVRQGNTSLVSRRGSAHSLDLPAYENDVLHALSRTGGLPGEEASNAVWIIRARNDSRFAWEPVLAGIKGSSDDSGKPRDCIDISGVTRIPLRVKSGSTYPFSKEDVILQTGDIVYIESRDEEYFYAGGLLPGSRIPLPRDRDLDVIGAMTLAGGAFFGPAGIQSGGSQFRSGVGNIVPPSRVIILRTVDENRQIQIFVNLKRAMTDSNERINIQSGDLVMLQYSPAELAANLALNFVNIGFAIPNK